MTLINLLSTARPLGSTPNIAPHIFYSYSKDFLYWFDTREKSILLARRLITPYGKGDSKKLQLPDWSITILLLK